MMGRATLTLVLLVSTAHALVHAYEMSLPSLEQQVAAEFYSDDAGEGARFTGTLSNIWRLMWGVGAIAAGWLVDRFGSRKLLVAYLWGCSASCVIAAASAGEQQLFFAMMTMGALASIYHPAGLALISHETSAVNRPRALGIHGIFGSAGIGLTPLMIGMLLDADFAWRRIYLFLCLPGMLVGTVIAVEGWRRAAREKVTRGEPASAPQPTLADYRSFSVLILLAAIQGFIYSALMSFLVRYLSTGSGVDMADGNYRASGVLLMGCLGQYVAGRWARPAKLERQLTWVLFANVPLLLWTAAAEGIWQPIAAGVLSLVHFMHQPLYNSLIAKYTPGHRRSLCYGVSFAMGLGLGSFGAGFAGRILDAYEIPAQGFPLLYALLAAAALVGGGIGIVLCYLNPPGSDPS